jgi:hypothetical protein
LTNLIETTLWRLQHQESRRTDPPLTDTKSKETF